MNTKDIEELANQIRQVIDGEQAEWEVYHKAVEVLSDLTQHHEAEVGGELLEQVCVVLDGMKQFIPPFVSDSPDSMTLQEVVMRTAYNQALDDAKTTINNLLNDNQ